MAKIRITQVREFDIEYKNYENIMDETGSTRNLVDHKEILQFEKEQFEHGDVGFEEIDEVVSTTYELVED